MVYIYGAVYTLAGYIHKQIFDNECDQSVLPTRLER